MGNGNNKTTVLALSGGGAKGAFQAGALEVLRDEGYSFDAISGVSVGALNGAMLATGQFEKLLEIWSNITPDRVLKKNSLLKLARKYLTFTLGFSSPPVSRYNNAPLRRLMEEVLLGKSVNLPFRFGYVKLESGEYVNATIRRQEGHKINQADIKRVLASTAIPVFFNPVRFGDSTAVDGGLRNISPISAVLPFNPDQIVIIPTEPVGEDPGTKNVRDILQIAFRAINIMLDEIFNEDIDRFFSINRLVKQAEQEGVTLEKSDGTPYSYVKPILIDPKESLGDGLDFANDRARELIETGRNRAREVLENLDS